MADNFLLYVLQVGSKVQHILDIWNDGQGVVSLHCFQSVIPVEAYTREACMVDAIGKFTQLLVFFSNCETLYLLFKIKTDIIS